MQVKSSIYLSFLGHVDTVEMVYDVFYIMRLRWRDPRLSYKTAEHMKILHGEEWFADKIWTPNVFIENEVC